MKKQTLMMMDQSQKSSEREKIALQQARDAIAAKEAALAEAAKAASRENTLLELMIEASSEMAGILLGLILLSLFVLCLFYAFN
jgi:hypothetical protein